MRRWLNAAAAHMAIALINATANWSIAARARLGAVLGDLLWWVIAARRRVTLANLAACFPERSAAERVAIGRSLYRKFGRGVLDHGVLWRGSQQAFENMVRVDGLAHLHDPANRPLILIAPHFLGLDAGGLRVNTLLRGVSIYSKASNPVWDAWLLRGRQRFNDPVLIAKSGADLRTAIRAINDGLPFYYLPDIDAGAQQSVFAPFFGVAAATIPMVSRLARITGAKVMMAVTEMTDDGYVLHFEAPWADFPGASVEEDTARMNREIERWVRLLPDQYLWTHKRFKTRPAGVPPIY